VRRLRSERGQAAVLGVVFLVALLGMATLVVDVGSWFRAKRAAQAASDAAVLAGAQGLPDAGAASALAVQYADENGGGLAPGDIRITSDVGLNDTISVHVRRETPGFFSRVFGYEVVDVGARAAARAWLPSEARWVAPFVVDEQHPLLSGAGCPCFDQPTDLDLNKVGPGNFKIINLHNEKGGTGPPILADWILNGYSGYMPLGWYYGDPGAKFNSSHVKNAMEARIGDELLFPIYRSTTGNGANLKYEIIGWVGFLMTSFNAHGNSAKIFGSFTRVVWEGIQSEDSGESDFGVRVVQLVE
jgi:hypothetical protein